MKQSLEEVNANTYVPWLDSALLTEESAYSVINKIAWFAGVTPVKYLRGCQTLDVSKNYSTLYKVDLHNSQRLIELLRNERVMPIIHGQSLKSYLNMIELKTQSELKVEWRSNHLRICSICISNGIHLRMHENLLIEMCPIHNIKLSSKCLSCGHNYGYELHAKQEAFCCLYCARQFLNNNIATSHTQKFRKLLNKTQTEYINWRQQLKLNEDIVCGINTFDLGRDHELSFLTSSRIRIASECKNIIVPNFISKFQMDKINLEIRTLNLQAPCYLACKVNIEKQENEIANIIQKCEFSNQQNSSLQLVSEYKYNTALKRVMTIFLTRFSHLHTDCFDIPYRIFGTQLKDREFPEDIFDCCPIAIGFWLWRLTTIQWYYELYLQLIYKYEHGLDANNDLLLYSLLKSYLHYCIFVAIKCANHHADNPDDIHNSLKPIICVLSYEIHWLPLLVSTNFNQKIDNFGYCKFVNFDATELINSMTCLGCDAISSRLNLSNNNSRPLYAIEYSWKPEQYNQVEPFHQLPADNLLHIRKRRLASIFRHNMKYDEMTLTNMGINISKSASSVIDSAINSKNINLNKI